MALLDTGVLFQSLLTEGMAPINGTAANDLSPESLDKMPLTMHRSFGRRDSNNDALWFVTLYLTVYTNDTESMSVNQHLDEVIQGWGAPGGGGGR